MRLVLFVSTLLLCLPAIPQSTTSLSYRPSPRELRFIRAAQNTDVAKLDPKLRKEALKDWITRNIFDYKRGEWETNDCGEQTGDPKTTPKEFPLCVEYRGLFADGRQALIQIVVGDSVHGLTRSRALWYAEFVKPNGEAVSLRALNELGPLVQIPAANWSKKPQ